MHECVASYNLKHMIASYIKRLATLNYHHRKHSIAQACTPLFSARPGYKISILHAFCSSLLLPYLAKLSAYTQPVKENL